MNTEEKKDRKELFGKFRDGFRKIKPYFWNLSNGERLLELPVTTMPIFRIPFHLSYLLFLSNFSDKLMMMYLNCAIYLCKLTKTQPSFLLHPLDLVGGDIIRELGFFPGMDVETDQKARVFKEVISCLSDHFQLTNMSKNAKHILRNGGLKVKIY